jgi:hypothetical protein
MVRKEVTTTKQVNNKLIAVDIASIVEDHGAVYR